MDGLTDDEERAKELVGEMCWGSCQEFTDGKICECTTRVLSAFASIRAERAKPTKGNEELLNGICHAFGGYPGKRQHDAIMAAFASIRAEGSAERAKLEAVVREARADVIGWLDCEHRLPRATTLLDTIDAALATGGSL